ncbi:hypothetical protein PSEUBRA_003432 [Kalmanozyma brasiliensis GHG001]|uniref:Uncharacterized protein n=1 Tax=Kalmanozyma brasiliensis (strain GHG001) TaxID=1365824 RepID=V5EXM2_KALBG|nr:uncharacterized protein PSEUBRA_003432 [Kalmanozyma brasiliensis GHG001]EST07254.1 hypothetical protein PSEUBRA_003432 [Kalmanozyma brasiliensis GHG001]
MQVRQILFYAFIVVTFIWGCVAPRTRPQKYPGSRGTVSKGRATERVQEFITRLSQQTRIPPRPYKVWLDVNGAEELEKILSDLLFDEGRNTNPKVLSLGTDNDGAHLAVSIVKPNPDAAAVLAGRLAMRSKGWETRRGLVLMHLRSNKAPSIVGWLRFKNHNGASQLEKAQGMISFEDLERLHGLTGIIKPI